MRLAPGRFHRPDLIRFAHLDLSVTGDATGVAVGCVDRFVRIERGGEAEVLPHVHVDLVLRVLPPGDGEIPYHLIRTLLYLLREHGMNLRLVTADSFQSVDMLQTLRQAGFRTWPRSMDRTTGPYEFLKSALYDGRVSVPRNGHLMGELLSLEIDTQAGKIDHPPGGSKDLADALAGVVYGLAMRRDVWTQHGVSPYRAAPAFVRQVRRSAADAADQAQPA